MLTPRPYISFSQMALYERNPQEYAKQYLYGQKSLQTQNMAFGSLVAEGLETGELIGDPLLDLALERLPKYELRDVAFEAELKNGKEKIVLLAKPDSAKADYSAFYEYKTSTRRWKQKDADESGQISFYATAMWLKTGKVPEDIKLIQLLTKYDDNGAIILADEPPIIYTTRRTTVDVIRMITRIKKCWAGIQDLCERELL